MLKEPSGHADGQRRLVTRELAELPQFLEALRDTLADAKGTIRVAGCDDAGRLIEVLGYKFQRGCGQKDVAFVTANAERAFLTIDSGFPLTALEESLQKNEPFTYSFPATLVPSISTASFAASRVIPTSGTSCILDVPTMQKSGGSLVVESTQSEPGRIFQVHWAGARTSNDRDDCGGSADLLLNSNEIFSLIVAAGGTGVRAPNWQMQVDKGIGGHGGGRPVGRQQELN